MKGYLNNTSALSVLNTLQHIGNQHQLLIVLGIWVPASYHIPEFIYFIPRVRAEQAVLSDLIIPAQHSAQPMQTLEEVLRKP